MKKVKPEFNPLNYVTKFDIRKQQVNRLEVKPDMDKLDIAKIETTPTCLKTSDQT